MKYKVEINNKYNFANESYANSYPNLHKYPATMLPQIGIEILKELNIKGGILLDPYCGSGSSFASALDVGISEMYGFDLNPLAVLISKAKFTKLSLDELNHVKKDLRNNVYEFLKNENDISMPEIPKIKNIDYWFSKEVITNINIIRYFISKIDDVKIRTLLWLPLSETIRECSYTRNNEFKLYRMKPEMILIFDPDVVGVFFDKLNNIITIYSQYYLPKLRGSLKVEVYQSSFEGKDNFYDIVLTSPPYGDSRTTVAYGQFSTLSNEWMGIDYARKVDRFSMGGVKSKDLYHNGIMTDYISQISNADNKRALEISSFYFDLERSISSVAKSVKKKGKVIYVVGNRTVKGIQLPTDQFIAEKFEESGFKHLFTHKRVLSSKAMPSRNSPTNKKGKTVSTMLYEYIVVIEKQEDSVCRDYKGDGR